MRSTMPHATYRVQLNRDFNFEQAAALVPYLAQLGVSHCYTSPYLKARAGSAHGYDIVDHNAFNPEIGDADRFEQFVEALRRHQLGHILDLVPNHMGVFGNDNTWWLDVLENGPASPYASYFDIDWFPLKDELRGKLLIPVLGDHYGSILERGELKLTFDPPRGQFDIYYWEHRFPVDPRTYPHILETRLTQLEQILGADHLPLAELKTLSNSFSHLPRRTDTSAERVEERQRDKEIHKRHFAALCQAEPAITRFIEESVTAINGHPGDPHSFDLLHNLLEQQTYRLTYWLVASDEINYRRFFDINDLAGLRMEEPAVFEECHRLVLQLLHEGRLDGLRIDHPDGLFDPLAYYQRLKQEIDHATGADPTAAEAAPSRYLVVEKILAAYEYLPEEWPVHGTTGYDFANQVNGLFVYAPAERELDHIYSRFSGRRQPFDDLLYDRKKLIIKVQLSSELNVLAAVLSRIAEQDRHTRDFTLNGCRNALIEVVACFPVYRTYIAEGRVSDEDRRYVDWAITQAKRRSPAADISIFDFIRQVLLEETVQTDTRRRRRATHFTMKFQQYTSPVMAKALEDTTFYIHHRLVSLNEVGGDPRRFGTTIGAFHHANQERLRRWPLAMLSTSTHDTKRSEDVRARINVLSEIPDEWQRVLARWSRLSRHRKVLVDGHPAPSRNDEYLLYQILVGTWPLEGTPETEQLGHYRERIRAYMVKAVKEAKLNTSWINPNADYEGAVTQFVETLLSEGGPFLAELTTFVQRSGLFGLYNALGQALLHLTVPGMPDIYQGTELWSFRLVDPDNRAPVDYAQRQELLSDLSSRPIGPQLTHELLADLPDGRAKLYLIWRTLTLRREQPALFLEGEYLPLEITGSGADHLCAFLRRHGQELALVAVPRWLWRLSGGQLPLDQAQIWGDTRLLLPAGLAISPLLDRFTGLTLEVPPNAEGATTLAAAQLFQHFPVALWVGRQVE